MHAKDEEMIKFLDKLNEKQTRRKRSIAARTYDSELHKNAVNGMQNNESDQFFILLKS